MTALLVPPAEIIPDLTLMRVRKGTELMNAWGDVLLIGEMTGTVESFHDDACRVCLTAWGQVLTLPLAALEVVEVVEVVE